MSSPTTDRFGALTVATANQAGTVLPAARFGERPFNFQNKERWAISVNYTEHQVRECLARSRLQRNFKIPRLQMSPLWTQLAFRCSYPLSPVRLSAATG